MARRFGGKFSPSGGDAPSARGRAGTSWRGRRRSAALFVAPLPLAVTGFFGDPVTLATRLAAFGLLILAAWLTREGVRAQQAYDDRRTARRPAIPRKIFASVLTAAGLGVAGYSADGGLAAPAILALLGGALHFAAFGPDPLRDKGAEGLDAFQADRVARAVDEAETYLAAISDAAARAGERALDSRIERFKITARDMFRTVQDDPRDLTAARKYLGVYLMGARDATVKFADLYTRTRDARARADYLALLDDLEDNFAAQTRKLLSDDRTDLDIEIDVLRERLQREGIRPG